MARKATSMLMRAAASLADALLRREKVAERLPEPIAEKQARPPVRKRAQPKADIPIDRIERTYIPTQTSLKAPFRASGDDRQRDQEFAGGVADDRWNDEDRYTNKSGDPRIGTHGRTYEPGERR